MMREEFEKRTGFYPSQSLYEIIEKHYTEFDGDKDAFCKAYKKDADGLATKIQHEIDEYEINRHHQLRKTGKKIDRRPVYCATDYHYIRFNTSRWYYEVWNDQLRPFYD